MSFIRSAIFFIIYNQAIIKRDTATSNDFILGFFSLSVDILFPPPPYPQCVMLYHGDNFCILQSKIWYLTLIGAGGGEGIYDW